MAGERKIVADNLKRVLLKEYMMKETERAGFGGLDIQRTPMGTRITLFAERPGIVIGRRGASIKELTLAIDRNFELDNPQIEVEEVENPALNAQIMAEKLSSALERGWHFRRAGHSTLRRIMESGAKGALIKISGKLTSQRHRTQKFKAGHIKYCGEPKNLFVGVGFATAKLKQGVIGVTVWITDPNAKLPDEIEVMAPVKVEEAPVAEAKAEAGEAMVEAAKVLKRVKKVTEQKPLGPAEKKLKRLKRVVEELGEEVELVPDEEAEVEEPDEDLEPEEEEASDQEEEEASDQEEK
ncbi:MAG: 30S ribosomal protein S3 [Thermoplasmata archaeon]